MAKKDCGEHVTAKTQGLEVSVRPGDGTVRTKDRRNRGGLEWPDPGVAGWLIGLDRILCL